jgi:hypothetical protein
MLVLAALQATVTLALKPPPPPPNPNFIVAINQLDEHWDNDYYCADVTGDVVSAGVPLQAHTCKEPNNDELFETNAPFEGMIYVSDHRMCLAMTSAGGGGILKLVTVQNCDLKGTDVSQLWQSTSDGQIHPQSDPDLCWTVGQEPGVEHGGGGDHLNKTFSVEPCDKKLLAYQQFHMGRGFVGKAP